MNKPGIDLNPVLLGLLLGVLAFACAGFEEGASDGSGGGVGGGGERSDAGFLAPPPETCGQSGQCDANELCAFEGPGPGHCVRAPSQECGGTDACYDGRIGINFLEVPGEFGEGPGCNETCPRAEGGHQLGICVDVAGDGSRRVCTPMCQYNDDHKLNNCVTDPSKGISSGCSRNHARLLSGLRYTFWCATGRQVTSAQCLTQSYSPAINVDQAIQCLNDAQDGSGFSCSAVLGGAGSCITDFNPNAAASQAEILDDADVHLVLTVGPSASGGGTGGGSEQCRTDCDCGRCSYCEKSGSNSVCRYAGEGPYGCYRGCN